MLTSWPTDAQSTVACWPARNTENHDLMHLTIRLFALQRLGDDLSGQVRELGRGPGVGASSAAGSSGIPPATSTITPTPLILLADHAPDAALRRCAQDLLNVLLTERAVLGIGGYLGGPSFRCRTADALHSPTDRKVAYLSDGRYDAFLPTVWLAFGLGEPRFDFEHAADRELQPATTEYASGNEPRLKQDEGLFFACSSFQPHPLVVALAREEASRRAFAYVGRRYLGLARRGPRRDALGDPALAAGGAVLLQHAACLPWARSTPRVGSARAATTRCCSRRSPRRACGSS